MLTACMTVDNVCEIYGLAVKYFAGVSDVKQIVLGENGMNNHSGLFMLQNLQDHARAFMIPVLNEVIKSEGYGKLDKQVMLQLMTKLADEGTFIGCKRRRQD